MNVEDFGNKIGALRTVAKEAQAEMKRLRDLRLRTLFPHVVNDFIEVEILNDYIEYYHYPMKTIKKGTILILHIEFLYLNPSGKSANVNSRDKEGNSYHMNTNNFQVLKTRKMFARTMTATKIKYGH